MEYGLVITIACYLASTGVYVSYLFLQKDALQKWGHGLLGAGFAVHTFVICYAFVKTGHVPIRNLSETLSIAGWAVAGVFLVVKYKYKLKILGTYTAPIAALAVIASSLLPGTPSQTKTVLNNFWVASHVVFLFIGEAALALACGAGILYLLQERAIKTKSRGFFFKRLPSLQLLDTTGYACIVGGFTMLTVGLVMGFVYAKSAWGRFFSGDPKEVWSGISWLIYATLLHERLITGSRGRRAAIWAIVGFFALLFTFFGVNFLLGGHHGEFTKY